MYKNNAIMNPKIFVGAAVGIIVVIIGIIGTSSDSLFNDLSNEGILSSSNSPVELLPLGIELEDISISEVSEKFATIDITFNVENPNQKSVILKLIRYHVHENDVRIHIGEVGDRPEGMVVGSSYFTVLSNSSVKISDTFTLRNTGNTPELWSALTTNSPNWRISGEVFYNLSSMSSGGEQEILFEFIP